MTRAEADQPAVRIREAWPEELERLREIAVAAKAHWGYELSWVEEWAAKGDFEPKILRERLVYVAESQGEPIGWAALIPRGAVGWLEDLWIEPGWIGRGVGRLLFEHVAARARELGAERLEWEVEPNARGFYQRMGGAYVRDSPVTEWGRVLEVFGVPLSDA